MSHHVLPTNQRSQLPSFEDGLLCFVLLDLSPHESFLNRSSLPFFRGSKGWFPRQFSEVWPAHERYMEIVAALQVHRLPALAADSPEAHAAVDFVLGLCSENKQQVQVLLGAAPTRTWLVVFLPRTKGAKVVPCCIVEGACAINKGTHELQWLCDGHDRKGVHKVRHLVRHFVLEAYPH